MQAPRIVVSVVSHGQMALVRDLLRDLVRIARPALSVVLTLNVPEPAEPPEPGVPLTLLRNASPKGFGANHNAAFAASQGELFCVANPDLRLPADPFPALAAALEDVTVGVAAPKVLDPRGALENSARRFPTPRRLLSKALRKMAGADALPDYGAPAQAFEPDWVAGTFLLFRRETFARIGGFDERYFLYYEDVDLCARLRLAGLRVVLEPAAHVVHAARRDSHRNPRYAWWHLRSIARWLSSEPYRRMRLEDRRAGK